MTQPNGQSRLIIPGQEVKQVQQIKGTPEQILQFALDKIAALEATVAQQNEVIAAIRVNANYLKMRVDGDVESDYRSAGEPALRAELIQLARRLDDFHASIEKATTKI